MFTNNDDDTTMTQNNPEPVQVKINNHKEKAPSTDKHAEGPKLPKNV